MVCTLGSGRMAALAKVLSGNPSQTASDDFGHQKSTMRLICRELSEANEVNLIDEEDMHIFDLEPMKDPLNLVLCNACKKPIKVSRYAIHAELCRSLTSVQDNTLKLVGNNECKKPARKDRRKRMPVNSNQATSVGEQGRFHLVDSSAISMSESQLVTATIAGVRDGSHALDGSATSLGNHNCLQTAILCPEKHSNTSIIAKEPTPSLDHFEAANSAISHKSYPAPARELPQVPCIEKEKTVDQVVGNQIPRQVHEYPMANKGPAVRHVPAPLATKIYYSQRNNRERAAISRMYYNSIMKESPPDQSCNLTTTVPTLPSFSNNYSLDEGFDQEQDKEADHHAHFARNPAQAVPQVSELYLSRPGGLSSNANISNQFPVNNIHTPCTVPIEKTTSNYFLDPYSLTGGPDN